MGNGASSRNSVKNKELLRTGDLILSRKCTTYQNMQLDPDIARMIVLKQQGKNYNVAEKMLPGTFKNFSLKLITDFVGWNHVSVVVSMDNNRNVVIETSDTGIVAVPLFDYMEDCKQQNTKFAVRRLNTHPEQKDEEKLQKIATSLLANAFVFVENTSHEGKTIWDRMIPYIRNGLTVLPYEQRMELKRAFNTFDIDGNGRLDKHEIHQVFQQVSRQENCWSSQDELNIRQDSQTALTYEEFESKMANQAHWNGEIPLEYDLNGLISGALIVVIYQLLELFPATINDTQIQTPILPISFSTLAKQKLLLQNGNTLTPEAAYSTNHF